MPEIGDMMSIQVIIEGSMNSSNPYFSSIWRRNFNVCIMHNFLYLVRPSDVLLTIFIMLTVKIQKGIHVSDVYVNILTLWTFFILFSISLRLCNV